ncbi:MAG: L-serine ammonia-lyase [Gammaproteobacteria bacterium]
MMISIFELFSIGIGPSSSHTVGPMRAACAFAKALSERADFDKVARVTIQLFGSLALTGHGHGTNLAVVLGLEGDLPESIDPETVTLRFHVIGTESSLNLYGKKKIRFDVMRDLVWHMQDVLPYHSNGMRFTAFDADGNVLSESTQYSIGGGFVVTDETLSGVNAGPSRDCPYPFQSAKQLLLLCEQHKITIAQLMMANETAWEDAATVRQKILNIWRVMDESIERGIRRPAGILPGGLKVRLRAPGLYTQLIERQAKGEVKEMDWLSLFAIAVNEENAAGKRIVTAPTNGAAGIIPCVMKYYLMFYPPQNDDAIIDYLLTCAAIGILYKKNASISAAEMGCQGEVGVACSMAAAGLAAIMGGTINQVESAAEMGMEHHLGLTCDPIAGLVQIPCIERNAMGAVQAVNGARLALLGDGEHFVSLDWVIRAMYETGLSMSTHFKETSLGGLAVSQPAC